MSLHASLVLASASPRRREMLSGVGLRFDVLAADIDESVQGDSEAPGPYASRLALEKAQAVHAQRADAHVLAADTVVAIGDASSGFTILGKPGNAEEAKEMLRLLSGKEHSVISAFCLLTPKGEVADAQAIETSVCFRDLSDEEIDAYIDTGEPFDKAGGYGIQGYAQAFISSISGSYSSVVGLPLCQVLLALEKQGLWFAHSFGCSE